MSKASGKTKRRKCVKMNIEQVPEPTIYDLNLVAAADVEISAEEMSAGEIPAGKIPAEEILAANEPVKEYIAFDTECTNGTNINPGSIDYTVQINDTSNFIENRTVFVGKEFLILDRKFIAQIHGQKTSSDEWQLSISFVSAENEDSQEEIEALVNPKISIFVKDQTEAYTFLSDYVFPFETRLKCGAQVYPFFNLSYEKHMRKAVSPGKKDLAFSVTVTDDFADTYFMENGLLLWKVNLSPARLNEAFGPDEREKELARTPFLYTREDGIRAQIRLIRDMNDSCHVQIRVMNKYCEAKYHNVVFYFVNPIDPTDEYRCLHAWFNFPAVDDVKHYESKRFAHKDALLPYIDQDQLLVKVYITS